MNSALKKRPWRNLRANEASGICHCVGISIPRSPCYQQRLWRNLEIRFVKYRCKAFTQRIEELKYFGVQRYNDAVNNFFFIKESQSLWNPYVNTSRQLAGPEISAKILEFFDKGLTEYLMFPEERYLQKFIG